MTYICENILINFAGLRGSALGSKGIYMNENKNQKLGGAVALLGDRHAEHFIVPDAKILNEASVAYTKQLVPHK